MPFYLFQGRYTPASFKAMVDNPQDREASARALITGLGGKLHSFFFSFGPDDFIALVEAADDTMA
ncbi:MAG: GYD domain-containing protein, partial [Paracoccaceae bacterium]